MSQTDSTQTLHFKRRLVCIAKKASLQCKQGFFEEQTRLVFKTGKSDLQALHVPLQYPTLLQWLSKLLWYQKRAVAITQESEIVRKCIVIDFSPVAMQESTHQKQKGALRLMEVRHKHLDDFIFVARCYYDLRACMQGVQSVMVKIGNDVGNGFPRRNGKCSVGIVVWFPLVHMQFAFRKVKTLFKFHTYIIKTFKRTHAGGANSDGTCVVSKQLFQGLPLYAYILRVHLVAFNFFRLDRFESSCPDMKCELLTVDSNISAKETSALSHENSTT